jgi:NADH:ubiquinone oxidoreductase subunit 5 (subunit L)/multisubunit Na+/H+ antiporter MnhA subunit
MVGAAAISGLPPLNGFVSEFLIYLGAMAGLTDQSHVAPAGPLMSVLVVGGLALIGGLAAACFTKAFGIVFLGEARSTEAAQAHEAGAAMRWPMIVLAGLCIVIGLTAPLWPHVLQPAVAVIMQENTHAPLSLRKGPRVRASRDSVPSTQTALTPTLPRGESRPTTATADCAVGPLTGVAFGSYILLGLIVLIMQVRRKLLIGRRVEQAITWDCGYAAPTPRMQYTASSFARPLTALFSLFLQPRDDIRPPQGLFPKRAALHTHTPDLFRRYIYEPLFLGIAWIASKLHWLQEGRIQIYVLYIALTILVLLIWKLG